MNGALFAYQLPLYHMQRDQSCVQELGLARVSGPFNASTQCTIVETTILASPLLLDSLKPTVQVQCITAGLSKKRALLPSLLHILPRLKFSFQCD
jgi:hypothetical protein